MFGHLITLKQIGFHQFFSVSTGPWSSLLHFDGQKNKLVKMASATAKKMVKVLPPAAVWSLISY